MLVEQMHKKIIVAQNNFFLLVSFHLLTQILYEKGRENKSEEENK